jgi:hypothetical protein
MARRRSCGGKPEKNADMTLRTTASATALMMSLSSF